MSDALKLSARQLESTFQKVLIEKLDAGIGVYKYHEDIERELPCVIIRATAKGWNLGMRIGSEAAQEFELKFNCLVSGEANSSLTITNLLARAEAAIETATGITGWRYLNIDRAEKRENIDNFAREETLEYMVLGLPA